MVGSTTPAKKAKAATAAVRSRSKRTEDTTEERMMETRKDPPNTVVLDKDGHRKNGGPGSTTPGARGGGPNATLPTMY